MDKTKETKQIVGRPSYETPYNEGKKIKTAKRLHDTSKVQSRSDRPVNVYKEYVTDSDTGEGGWYIWYTTEMGNEVGRKSLDKFNESTLLRTEEGQEYTIPYTKVNRDKVYAMKFGQTKFHMKDGVQPMSLLNPEIEF